MTLLEADKQERSKLVSWITLLAFIVVSVVGAWGINTQSRLSSLESSKALDEQSIISLKESLTLFQSQLTSLNAKMDVIVDLDTKLLTKDR